MSVLSEAVPEAVPRLTPAAAHAITGINRRAYSPAEVGELLGVTSRHVHNLIHRGLLPSCLIGRSRRILAEDLDAYLTASRDEINRDST